MRFTRLDNLFRKTKAETHGGERRTCGTSVRRSSRRHDQQPAADADLTLDQIVLPELTSWMVGARKDRSEESQLTTKFDMAEHEIDHLIRLSSRLRQRLTHIDCGEVEVSEDEHNALKHELTAAIAKSERLEELKEQWSKELESVYHRQQHDQTKVLALVEGAFVRKGLHGHSESTAWIARSRSYTASRTIQRYPRTRSRQ